MTNKTDVNIEAIKSYQKGINAGKQFGEVETKKSLADWFENCGMDELTPQQVAQIIRKWRPE